MNPSPLRRLLLLLLLVAPAAPGCVTTGVNPVTEDTRVYAYSWQEEKQIGQRADDQIRRKYGVYDEAQLAVVLGHEIAHVAARHASQQAARKTLARGLLLGGAVIGQATLGLAILNQIALDETVTEGRPLKLLR
ncbi:MAG: M48 family metalloprotease [Salinibacter sp.]